MSIYATTFNELTTPGLVAYTNTNGNIKLSPKTKVIDVRRDFIWSILPKTNSLETIPALYLVEREQETNSLIASALYYITSFLDKSSPDQAASESTTTHITEVLNKTANTELGASSKSTLASLTEKIKNLASTREDTALLSTDYLKSYIGIYLTKKTGFQYVLPYFSSTQSSITNSWQAEAQTKTLIADTLLSQTMGAVEQTAGALNITQPGTFIEKPRYFHYPTEGESITVNFPLLNTYNPYNNALPYKQNYDLLWILAYQNKPYRTSFSRIIPPKLYTLTVPGVKYMPYCFISNMTVDFQGTQRNLEVTTPTGENIMAPIPDAYNVSITFTSLLADIGNMMVTKDFGKKINTRLR
jgi:hypothetical protein